VVNSSVVEGLNSDPNGQIQLRPFCGNTVTADLVCLNISLADLDVPNVTPIHVVKVTCAVVPDLYDKFILTADVTDHLSHSNTNLSITVSQARVNDMNDIVNTPADVDDSNATHAGDDVSVFNSPVANDDVTAVSKQNDVECKDIDEDCSNITDGGSVPTSDIPTMVWPVKLFWPSLEQDGGSV